MAKIYGIDVSHHQGAINWKQTASELRRVNGCLLYTSDAADD